jgi:hypothetical protein
MASRKSGRRLRRVRIQPLPDRPGVALETVRQPCGDCTHATQWRCPFCGGYGELLVPVGESAKMVRQLIRRHAVP